MQPNTASELGHAESSQDCSDLTSGRAARIRISETFSSRQGEGLLTGTDSFFVRTSGCNLRCWFCDTPYASWNPEGEFRTVSDLLGEIKRSGLRHVVVTGGEPLIWPACESLVQQLQQVGIHVTIETAGTIDRAVCPDLLSLSPKLRGSGPDARRHSAWSVAHEARRMPLKTMRVLIERAHATQVKFVVSDVGEFFEIDAVVKQLRVPADWVWIMPEGRSIEKLDRGKLELAEPTRQRGYRLCDRMQIHWYGDKRGT